MNYYILPKNNSEISINANFIKDEFLNPYISQSLVYFLNMTNKQLSGEKSCSLNITNKIVNTYNFIYTIISNTNLSVSKVKVDSVIFYELIEIFNICSLNDYFNNKNKISTMHLSENYTSSVHFFNLLRENNDDLHVTEEFNIEKLKLMCEDINEPFDYLFFEFKTDDYFNNSCYFKNMLFVLNTIIKYQNINGISIIKVDNICHKLIIDILYILSGLFEKVIIFKPTVSNNTTNERYIICKYFNQIKPNYRNYLVNKLTSVYNIISTNDNDSLILESIISNNVPYYFVNKIQESNAVIGQQQLTNLMLIINILQNKNKEDKIELIKKNNIQKCIQWCEKYNIPHNKFGNKHNIFLNTKQNEQKNMFRDSDGYSSSDYADISNNSITTAEQHIDLYDEEDIIVNNDYFT